MCAEGKGWFSQGRGKRESFGGHGRLALNILPFRLSTGRKAGALSRDRCIQVARTPVEGKVSRPGHVAEKAIGNCDYDKRKGRRRSVPLEAVVERTGW
jgi:hypothetical protein